MSDVGSFLIGAGPHIRELLVSAGAEESVSYDLSMSVSWVGEGVSGYGFSLVPAGSTPAEPESIAPPDPDLPGPTQAQLMALWKAVEDFRDKHEVTCVESVFQNDPIQIDATTAISDFFDIIGYGEWDEETDKYVGARR